MKQQLPVILVISIIFGGFGYTMCSFIDTDEDLDNYEEANIWTAEEEEFLDFDNEPPSQTRTVDQRPTTTKPMDITTDYPKNAVLDLLHVMQVSKSHVSSTRKQHRLLHYMTELYNNLSTISENFITQPDSNPGHSGFAKDNGKILDGPSIRGMQAYKAFFHRNGTYTVWFNLSDVSWSRMPQQAELVTTLHHGKVIKSRSGQFPRTQDEGKDDDVNDSPWQKVMIRTGRRAHPYLVMDVTEGVKEWIADMQNPTTDDEDAMLKLSTFPQNVHRSSTLMKPFLVLYYGLEHNSLLQGVKEETDSQTMKRHVHQRTARSAAPAPSTSSFVVNKCALREWYLDFNDLGWSDWVLQPAGIFLNYCSGECPAILMQAPFYRATNHAMLRGMYRARQPPGSRKGQMVPLPCCTPTRLAPETMMYMENDQIIVRPLAATVAVECGCQ